MRLEKNSVMPITCWHIIFFPCLFISFNEDKVFICGWTTSMKFFSRLCGVSDGVTQLHHVRAAAQNNVTHYWSAREHNHNKTTPFPPGQAARAATASASGSKGERSGWVVVSLGQGWILVEYETMVQKMMIVQAHDVFIPYCIAHYVLYTSLYSLLQSQQ